VQGLVGAGFGAALVPLLAVDTNDERVTVLELEPQIPRRRIALAWHRDRHRSPAARAFVDVAADVCREVGRHLTLAAA
jgi:DNA-binding transcriptional LysR family regulator